MDIFDLAFGGIGAKERLQRLGPFGGGDVLQVGHCPNLSRNEIPRRHSSLFPVQNRRFSVTESDTKASLPYLRRLSRGHFRDLFVSVFLRKIMIPGRGVMSQIKNISSISSNAVNANQKITAAKPPRTDPEFYHGYWIELADWSRE